MSDELTAFFAKKASKGKKKVVKLAEVADQLERRAKIQDEIDELEVKTSDETVLKPRNSNIDNEDSEWLDFDEKPLPAIIKEMEDVDIESEEEEKQSSAEPVKTWNVNNNESVEGTPPPVQKETKYVPKAVAKASRNPLDINNEMLFPTLGNASQVEKELKKEEEENMRIQLEEKRQKEEEQQRIEAARQKRYNPPRGQEGEGPRKPIERKQQPAEPTGPTEAESTDNWRGAEKPPSKESFNPPREQESEGLRKPVERKQQPEPVGPTEAESTENWRGVEKPPPKESYNPPRAQESEGPRKPVERRQQPEPAGPTEAESAENWRGVERRAVGTKLKDKISEGRVGEPSAETESAENWRGGAEKAPSKESPTEAEPADNWRGGAEKAASKEKYVPPWKRNKT